MMTTFQKQVDQVFISDEIYYYIVAIVDATRHNEYIEQGASPRGSLATMKVAKACAFMHDRDYVIPSDVKDVVHMVLAHRIILNYDAKMKEMSAYSLLDDILDHIREPGIE